MMAIGTEITGALTLVAMALMMVVAMARQYMTVETAALAVVDTPTPMIALGANAAVNRLVEANKTRIKRAWVLLAADGAALGAGVAWVTLAGDGIGRSAVTIPLGGYGGTLVTSDGQDVLLFEINDLDIPVVPASEITFNCQMNLDLGTCAALVTLEIE